MKTSLHKLVVYFCIISVGIILNAFQYMASVSSEINIQDALTQKKISSKLKSTGNYNGNSVVVELTNLTPKPMKIKIPTGTLFAPSNEGEQTLITVEEQFVSLAPKGKAKQIINAYCCQAHDACPKETSTFKMDYCKDDKFQKLFVYMKGKKIDPAHYQSIVWTVSDNHSVSSIPKTDSINIHLRDFLCKLTNQVDTWYNSSQVRRVDLKGNIVTETVNVGGYFTYSCPANTIVHQEVHKETGGVIFKDQDRRTLAAGETKGSFHLNVKGWEKGKYILKVMNKAKVLKEYEFVI